MSNSLAAASSRASSPSRPPAGGRQPVAPTRPALQVVQAPVVQRGRAAAAVLAMLLLAAGLVTLLLINTGLAQGSFRLDALQNTSDVLSDRQQALTEDIEAQAAPQRLAARARSMGMVPSESEAFIRLSDGKVFGVAEPAKGPARPTVTTPATTATGSGGTGRTTSPAATKGATKTATKGGTTSGTRTTTSDAKAR